MHMKKGKRVCLIEPRGNIPFLVLPLALGFLKSNIPDRHEVKVLDCSRHNIPADSDKFRAEIESFKPHVVGVSASMQTYLEGMAIVKVIKSINPKITTIMGGAHPSIFADAVMQNEDVDFVFRGESEMSFPVFLDLIVGTGKDYAAVKGLVYRRNGAVVKNEIDIDPDLDRIKIPDYEAIDLGGYIKNGYNYGGHYARTAPIWVTRGCPYACSYCSASLINGLKIRRHSIPYVINWIDHLYNKFSVRQFAIIDDNFTMSIDYVKEFCRTIISLRDKNHFRKVIFFATPNGIRLDRIDQEMLGLMKRVGWKDLTIAPESGSVKTLKRMRKHIKPEAVPDAVRMIKDAGLNVRGNFMVGFPGETNGDLKKTVKLIRSCKFDFFNISLFYPIPGTPIFDELVATGEISPDYMPQEIYRRISSFGKNIKQAYVAKDIKQLNPFILYMRELIYLTFRNPYSIIFFIKYYGLRNVFKKLIYLWEK